MLVRNLSKKYSSNEKGQYSCQYYVVFCTKFNRRIFTSPYINGLKDIFHQAAIENEMNVIDIVAEGDAIQLMLSCPPHISVQKSINQMKIAVAKELHQKYPELKTRLPQMWTKKNFISSMGDIEYQSICQYIEEQRNDKGKSEQ